MRENALEVINSEEVTILDRYIPRMLSEEELELAINKIIREESLETLLTIKDLGKIMNLLKYKSGATYDGAIASKLIKQKLIY